jgi:hypothetical protein
MYNTLTGSYEITEVSLHPDRAPSASINLTCLKVVQDYITAWTNTFNHSKAQAACLELAQAARCRSCRSGRRKSQPRQYIDINHWLYVVCDQIDPSCRVLEYQHPAAESIRGVMSAGLWVGQGQALEAKSI